MALAFAVLAVACSSNATPDASTVSSGVTKTIPMVADGAIGAYLDVPDTTVAAGGELSATVVVLNRTGEPVSIASCGPFFYGAGFESDTVGRTDPPFLTCLGPPLTIPVGESTWPITAVARYSGCGGTGVRPVPACVDGRPPSLPAGDYRLVVSGADPRAPIPAPVDVTIR